MLGLFSSRHAAEIEAKLVALDKSQAIIEFALDGTILTANKLFQDALGYSLGELQGKNHSMLVEASYRDSRDYAEFWNRLRRGEFQAAQFKRIGKGGREVWIEASYNPLIGRDGKPFKVVKFATDVSGQKAEYADLLGQVQAINKSQAVIEFAMDGTVLDANDNFLKALGYSLAEIKGRQHSLFVEPAYRDSRDYQVFWTQLRAGEFQAGQFKRIAKGGKPIWIEASYNPIFDLNGKPVKVVKYATDITAQVALLDNLKLLIERNFGEIDQALGQSSQQSQEASRATGETAANVQMMAASAEELAASVGEIAQSMAGSRTATDSAFERTQSAGDATQRLSSAAIAMGGIVGLIQTIAGQINLLALNATIESARAGEAGRGFAVVASEVKNLANQAAKATEQIAREIDGVQTISTEVVGALNGIRMSVETMREHVVATASAVEEQSKVTQSMSASMNGVAGAVQAISGNISGISAAVHQVEQAVGRTKDAARVLAR